MHYKSAFDLLVEADPHDSDPDLVMMKVDVLMKYHVRTDFFQKFGLRDLLPGQSLEHMRDGNLAVPKIRYKPDSILNKMIYIYPENYNLKKVLGNFYYEALTGYPDGWLLPDSVLLNKIYENYSEAYDHGVYDQWSLFGMGYVLMLKEESDKAIPLFEQALQLDPDFAQSYYNLGVAYLSVSQYEKALNHAQMAFSFRKEDEVFSSESARLIATIYEEKNELEEAVKYYRNANQIRPNDYSTMLPLLNLEMRLGLPEYMQRSSDLLALAPTNAIIYQDLLRTYSENEREKEFVKFMESLKNLYRPNLTVMANVYLHQAIAQYDIDEWVAAKLNFEKARNLFRNLFNPNHSVFKVIDSYTEAIRKKSK